MKKITLHRTAFLLFVILLLGGCNNWLDLEPQDAIIKDRYWKTKEQVEAAVVGVYASLLGAPDGARSIPELAFLWGEMRADMIVPNNNALFDEEEVVNGNILQTNGLANWRVFYQTINYCNTVLDLAPAVLDIDPTFKESQWQAYRAEMLTIRSLLYFYLVRTFKEVPLKIAATTSDDDPYEIPKSTEEEILNQLVADLNEAERLAVVSYGNQDQNKGRVTRYTVNALQADIYLWKEDYASCKAACDKIINSGQFGVVESHEWFPEIFVTGNSNESIFEIQFDAEKTNPFFNMFATNGRWLSSILVLEEVYTIDFDVAENKDIRGENASLKSDGRIWKYMGWDGTRPRSIAESYAHWIVYRLADILLMKAEAMALTGEVDGAREIVNKIRTRGHALEATYREIDSFDVQGMLEYILEERAREFAFEGKRWFDVLRHARRNNYANLNLLINMAVKTAPIDRQQSIINKLRDTNSHYLPVFQYELQTNKRLVQNPFYAK
jgi:starch-binding outer membrane protein, SusD/RagB family